MLFSDLFKRFVKTEPVAAVHPSPSALPDHLSRAREAALEFLAILRAGMVASDGSLHAGTMLCAAAWLTGTSLYRSFRFREDSAPGTIIKSNEVNATWEGLMHLLEQYNLHGANIPVGRLILAGMAVPDFHQPQVELPYVQNELQSKYNAVMKKHGFGYLDGARVGIMICSILIQQYHTAGVIASEPAAGIIAERVLQAAKTVPPPLVH